MTIWTARHGAHENGGMYTPQLLTREGSTMPLKRPSEIAAEQDRCYALSLRGLSYRKIAELTGLSHDTVMHRIKAEAEERQRGDDLDLMRQHAADQLDARRQRMWAILTAPHPLVQNGKIVKDGDGHVIMDAGPVLRASAEIHKIDERWSRLWALDSPTPLEVALTRRTELESEMVAEAVNAVATRLQLPPEHVVYALEVAGHALDPEGFEDPGDPPEVVQRTEPTSWPFRQNGKDYIVVDGIRYERVGLHHPSDLPFVDGEVVDDDLTAGQGAGGPGVSDDDPDALRLELEAAKAEFPDLEWGDDE